jgi:hypothetical protein
MSLPYIRIGEQADLAVQADRDLLAAEYEAAARSVDGRRSQMIDLYAKLARQGQGVLIQCALRAMARTRAEHDGGWKIVWCDGYGRRELGEKLIASGIRNAYEGNLMLEGLRANASDADRYKLVSSDYHIFKRELSLPHSVSNAMVCELYNGEETLASDTTHDRQVGD